MEGDLGNEQARDGPEPSSSSTYSNATRTHACQYHRYGHHGFGLPSLPDHRARRGATDSQL
jgi:hypothetical protein